MPQQVHKLSEWQNRHAGVLVYLVGKGPSLDTVRPPPGAVTCCINQSVYVVDWPTYYFAHDPRRNLCQTPLPAGVVPVLDVRVRLDYPEAPDAVVYSKVCKGLGILDRTRDQIAASGELFADTGTGHSAIHFAWFVGAVGVVLVGMDGAGGYAECVKPYLSEIRRNPATGLYPSSRSRLISVGRQLGLQVYDACSDGSLVKAEAKGVKP